MGNTQNTIKDLAVHQLYGQAVGLAEINGQKTHHVCFPVIDDVRLKFMNDFKKTDGFNKNNLLLSNSFQVDESILCGCGQARVLDCTFPFYPYTLEKQIERRSQQKKFLKKQQLLYLVYQIIKGASNFDTIQQKVGDIKPTHILLNDTKKKVKLVNYFTSPNQQTGFQKAMQSKERAYLAPQQLIALEKVNSDRINNSNKAGSNPLINVHKADSFSLGLTILAVGNLKQLYSDLYDFKTYSFNWQQLQTQEQNFKKRYGSFLTQIVKGFIHQEPKKRLYIGQVAALLRYYEKQIIQMLDFQPDFDFLEKYYNLHYPKQRRSELFYQWFKTCRQICCVHIHRTSLIPVVVVHTPTKVHVHETITETKHYNPHITFTYTSPTKIKL